MQSIDVKPPPMTTTRLPDMARVGQAERGDAQVLEAVEHAVGVLAGHAQLVGLVAADGDADGIEALVLQVVEREVLAEPALHDQLDAEVR